MSTWTRVEPWTRTRDSQPRNTACKIERASRLEEKAAPMAAAQHGERRRRRAEDSDAG